MKRAEDAFPPPSELARRTLAAQERLAEIQKLYENYYYHDWKVALLADIMLDSVNISDSSLFEWDLAIAELVAGVTIESGKIPHERKRFARIGRRSLRGRDEQPLPFDYGSYAPRKETG